MRAVALAAALLGVAAHPVDPSVRAVLDEVRPAVDGLIVQVAASVAAQLVVENRTGEVLEVLDEAGEPFLRIGPDRVEADVASVAWARAGSPAGTVPAGVDDAAPARWVAVAAGTSYGWFDHRLHPPGASAPDDWIVPMRLGGEPIQVRGHLEARQVRGAFGSRLVAGGAPFAGVEVQVLDGRVPGVLLRNVGSEPVLVLGADGEPFARIGPTGVEVNAHSPTWAAHAAAAGLPAPAVASDATAPAAWELQSTGTTFAWLDDRGRWPEEDPPADILAAGEEAVVLRWSLPVERAGERAIVDAETVWVPAGGAPPIDDDGGDAAAGGAGTPVAPLVAGAVAVGAAAAVLRGRRSLRAHG